MASAILKTLSMAECHLTSLPTLFTTKTPYPFLSLPLKPIKHSHLSSSSSSPLSSFSLKTKNFPPHIVTFVAQTSDWAQQEEDEEKEENVNNWDNQPVEATEGSEGEEESYGDEVVDESEDTYQEPPEEAKLFVGNLPFDIDSEKLAQLFDQAGVVEIAEVNPLSLSVSLSLGFFVAVIICR